MEMCRPMMAYVCIGKYKSKIKMHIFINNIVSSYFSNIFLAFVFITMGFLKMENEVRDM